MQAFSIQQGGLGALGQVTTHDVVSELASRGYAEEHHVIVPPPTPTLTKRMAINVAIDEAIQMLELPRTYTHYYRCPSGSCPIHESIWSPMVGWCVKVANGYLNGTYGVPTWAQQQLHSGALHGAAMSGLNGLRGFDDWLQTNSWFVQSVGDTINNYGEFLTAKNVQDAIKQNTDQQLTKADALALVAQLQAQGMIPSGKTATVAEGAKMATASSLTVPLLVIGGVVAVVMLAKR